MAGKTHSLCCMHNASMVPDRKAFIRANTRLKPVPHVPEISLYVADESVPITHPLANVRTFHS